MRIPTLHVMIFAFEIRRESNPRGSKPPSHTVYVLVPRGEFAWEHLPVHVVQESKPGMVIHTAESD